VAKNKLKNFRQLKSYDHVFQPEFKEIFQDDFFMKGKWAETFFKNNNPIVLELGCGKGEYTTGLAEQNPDINYIGIDIKGARMWKGAKTSLEKGLKNVAFIRSSIEPIQSFFGENEISEIWLTFSDPQPYKPKKRLSSSLFFNKYMSFVKPGAIIHLKTDSLLLFEYTYSLVKENEFIITNKSNDIYNEEDIPNAVKNIQTFYEKKFISLGKKIKYLEFIINKKSAIIEPSEFIKTDVLVRL
jgi:tRNA (guanine-N7-)-methyltransferase